MKHYKIILLLPLLLNCTNQARELSSNILDLYTIGAVRFGSFTFKSGIKSSNYVDMRKLFSHPDILLSISTSLARLIKNIDYDLLCAVPYGALPITTALSIITQKPMIMARKEAKQHGLCNQIEGTYRVGMRVMVVEDVITTGSSILETVRILEEVGLQVTDVVVILDRQQQGVDHVQQCGYKVHALFTLDTIISTLIASGVIE